MISTTHEAEAAASSPHLKPTSSTTKLLSSNLRSTAESPTPFDAEMGGEEDLLPVRAVVADEASPNVRERRNSARPGSGSAFLTRCANDWCARSGGEALRTSPRERSYEELVAAGPTISEQDAEQIAMGTA